MSAADGRPADGDATSESDDVTPSDQTLSSEPVEIIVEARAHGWRLDHYLVRLFPNYSRELFQKAIKAQRVLVNGLPTKPSHPLRVNDVLAVGLPEEPDSSLEPEDIPLDVLHEDDDLIVLNKPADLITHPGKGNYGGTLANALQFHFDRLSDVAGSLRPGIVHRLDRDTTGVLVVAKDNQTHQLLSKQFEERTVRKTYEALVFGEPEFDSDYIETHLRTHARQREKMQVCEPGGRAREAVTYYEVATRFRGFARVRLFPKTGRTHQLRVHLQHIGHPILADRVYGGRGSFRLEDLYVPLGGADPRRLLIARQALHARRLEFKHPRSGKPMTFEAPLPDDFRTTLDALAEYASR